MKTLKKFFIALFAMVPISAGALTPVVWGLIGTAVGIVGISTWRTLSPVNMKDAFDFFSSCWTCQMFSDVMVTMSTLLPGIYKSIGHIVIPFAVTLLAVFIAWRLAKGYINGRQDDASKIIGNFGTYTVKLAVLISLLLIPLPRLITNVFIEPALTIGTSLDYMVSDNNSFSDCMVATAMSDPMSISQGAASYGAFSPKLRHQLACEVANIHQVTGIGMTVGWTLMNMAFNTEYMHKIFWLVPFFPNIPMLFGGLLILVLYFFALLPIPLYFLEVFVKLSMDLIMLPLMLMAWMFDEDDFSIFPKGGRTIRQMIDDVIKAMVGIALTVVFLTFSIMFLNAVFGTWSGAHSLQEAIMEPDLQISAKMLIDGLLMKNDSLVTVILMGIFIAMFMTMIPQLTSMLFKIQISDKYYQTAKKDLNIMWKGFGKIFPVNKGKSSGGSSSGSYSSGGGASSGGGGGSGGLNPRTLVEYIESTGSQYIDTGIIPSDNIGLSIKLKMKGSMESFLFGARDGVGKDSFVVELFHGGNPSHVYIEYGSFTEVIHAPQSLSDKIISVRLNMNRNGFSIHDESGSVIVSKDDLPNEAFRALYNMFLFGLNDQGTVRSRASCKVYSCEIYENGMPIREFLPVVDGEGTACLWEHDEQKFYYNQGISPFSAGPVKK